MQHANLRVVQIKAIETDDLGLGRTSERACGLWSQTVTCCCHVLSRAGFRRVSRAGFQVHVTASAVSGRRFTRVQGARIWGWGGPVSACCLLALRALSNLLFSDLDL